MPRPTLLRRLVPSSLAGQIILVVAIALFVAQAINFTLLLRERERQRLTVATAPAVARIIDAIERRSGNPAHSFGGGPAKERSEEHTSELQSLMRISYAVFCLKKNNKIL